MVSLVLVLGDQLSEGLAGLSAADPTRDVVVMVEAEGDDVVAVTDEVKLHVCN